MDRLGRREFLLGTSLAVGVGLAGCIEGAQRTEWTKFRASGDNQASTREHPGDTLEVGWEVDVANHFGVDPADVRVASPIGDTETMYLSSRIDMAAEQGIIATGVLAFDVADGTIQWSRLLEQSEPLDDALAYPPVMWDDLLLAIDGRQATVFERDSGQTAFEFDLPWVPTTLPGGDRALVALGGELVAMLDIDEAQDVRWTIDDQDEDVTPVNPLTVLDDRVFIPIGNRLRALRRGDGERLWEHTIAADDATVRTTSPLVDGQHLHLRLRSEDGDEQLRALSRNDRTHQWEYSLGAPTTDTIELSAYRSGSLYATHERTLHAVEVDGGDLDYTQAVDVSAPYPTVGGDAVYLLGSDELVIVDRQAGDVLDRVTLPGEASDLPQEAVPREGALVLSRQSRVLGLQPV